MPSFQNPLAFLFLLLVPLLIILRKFKIFSKIEFPAVLGDWEGRLFTWKGVVIRFFSIFAKITKTGAILCVIIAFADPVISHQEKTFTSLGSDLIFVVDTSPSMAGKDVDDDTRMNAAKNTIKKLAVENEGLRYGLVLLGSEAEVAVPPTSDHQSFFKEVNNMSVGMMGDGSAIGDGLSTAICHLISSSAPKKIIILLTDGENNAGEIHPETAATLANSNNIPIYVIGIGSRGTVPIEYEDPKTGKIYSGYLDSNFNSASLKKIASSANGHYYEVRTTEDLLTTLQSVTKAESSTQSFTYKTISVHYFDKFLIAGIILFIATWIFKRVFMNEIV